MEAQKKMIERYLAGGGRLTPLEALKMFGCFRLSARIFELRNKGLGIKTEMKHINGKYVAEYYVPPSQS